MASSTDGDALMEEEEQPLVFEDLPLIIIYWIYTADNCGMLFSWGPGGVCVPFGHKVGECTFYSVRGGERRG